MIARILRRAPRLRGAPFGRRSTLSRLLVLPLACAACAKGSDRDAGGAVSAAAGADATGAPAGDMITSTQRSADTALIRLAGELLQEAERHSGIQAVRPPALASSSREDLELFLSRAFSERMPTEKAEAVAAVYARLGLLPDTLRLVPLLRSLLLEQVVGYYDPVSDTLYVVEGAAPEQVELVLVHELVHALQDQSFDLDSLTRAVQSDNDRAAAAQAALEGHATYAMMEWLLSRQTGATVDLAAMPDLGAYLGALDPTALAGTPLLRDAPAIIRETLIFPYMSGLVFLQQVWAADPDRPLPFGDYLPESSEQVLHADRFVQRDRPAEIIYHEPLPSGWSEVHADGLGELETRVLLETHLGDREAAASAALGWDGDRYRLVRGPRGEVLVWVTVWDSEEDAAEFEAAARRAFERRYETDSRGGEGTSRSERRESRSLRVEGRVVDGRRAVVVVDAASGLSADSIAAALRFQVRGG
jgi:hypothetical protein